MKTKIVLMCLLCTIIQACNHSTIFVGHRGCLLGVENTAEAFINGATHFGYQGLECDVKVTVDSQLVCWHDDHLKRVGIDSIMIPATTLEQLQSLSLVQTRKDEKFKEVYEPWQKATTIVIDDNAMDDISLHGLKVIAKTKKENK